MEENYEFSIVGLVQRVVGGGPSADVIGSG
jgi:hypothetical protein